ncbi:hypothetical protein L0F63_006530 [Massospora cicadina]|nr:hypothetical protein L0F63_006530 [Massospora cicadina]
MRPLGLIYYVSSIILLAPNVRSIFPDQAGLNDWHLRLVGGPLQTIFYRLQPEGDSGLGDGPQLLPIVRTEKNLIAALNVSTGDIVWRRSPNANETLLRIELDDVLWSISSLRSHHYVRLYHPLKGHLLWEFRLGMPEVAILEGGSVRGLADVELAGTSLAWIRGGKRGLSHIATREVVGEKRGLSHIATREVVTLSGGRLVVKHKVGTSKPMWAWQPSESAVTLSKVFAAEKGVYAVGVESHELRVALYHLNVTDGQLFEVPRGVSKHRLGELSSHSLQSFSAINLTGDRLAEATHSQVKHAKLHVDHLNFVAGGTPETFHIQTIANGSVTHALSFSLAENRLALIASYALGDGVVGDFVMGSELQHVSRGSFGGALDATLQVIGAKGQAPEMRLGLNRNQFGGIRSASLSFAGADPVTVLVATEDGSMHLFSGPLDEPGHVWSREESLAYAETCSVLELPESHLWTQADVPELDGLMAKYLHRLHSNWEALTSVLSGNRPATLKTAEGVRIRDRLGIRKLLPRAGAIVWSRFLGERVVKLVLLRSALVKLPPVLGVVTRQEAVHPEPHSAGETRVLRIDGFTGQDFSSPHLPPTESIPGPRPQIMPLPISDPSESTRVLAFVNATSVTALPRFPTIHSELRRFPQPIFGFFANGSRVGGFHLVSQGDRMAAEPIWQLGIPTGQLLAVVTPTHRHCPSLGRVLNDRRVLYKYLNPHLVLVASYGQGLTVSLLDAVSGALLHRAVHPKAQMEPFHAVVTENTVVYHYWEHSDFKGYVTVVLELFESHVADVREVGGTFSSFSGPTPYVASRAFVTEGAATAIGVTVTRHGIARREFLFALSPANHIVAIPSPTLDALRPYPGVPKLDTAEGAVEYSSIIPFDSKLVLSYGQDVLGVTRLASSPTAYESTTAVVGYGQDIFFASYAPSQPFDVLRPDFSKAALLFTVMALGLGILAAAPMLKAKKLRDQWL